jgi:hypothetical protein
MAQMTRRRKHTRPRTVRDERNTGNIREIEVISTCRAGPGTQGGNAKSAVIAAVAAILLNFICGVSFSSAIAVITASAKILINLRLARGHSKTWYIGRASHTSQRLKPFRLEVSPELPDRPWHNTAACWS